MKYFKFIICVLFCACCIKLYSHNLNKEDSLIVFEVTNPQLNTILDSIIEFEKRCDYYNPDYVYYFIMEANIDSSYNITIGTNGCAFIKFGHEIGCFTHKKHIFIIESQFLEKKLFNNTVEKKLIKYYIPRQDGVIDLYEDDSFTNWYYKYEADNFIFLERVP